MRLSAGIIPFRREKNRRKYLLLRAFAYWDFPKGEVSPGEDPWSAALRELYEESGIVEVIDTPVVGYFETKPYSRGKVARYYLGEVGDVAVKLGVSPELGRAEHHEFRWASYAEARELLGPRVREALDWAERSLKAARAD